MKYTRLGKTDIKISKIGFGTWGISGDWGKIFSKKEIFNLFSIAYDLGINFFDTAPVYGNGYIEEILGKFSKKHEILIATKIPAKKKPSLSENIDISKSYDIDYINNTLFQSLRRLNRSYIDLLMLHNWHPQWNRTGSEILEYLNKLKIKGKIKALGISLPNWMNAGLDNLINIDLLDFIMVPLNLFQQWPINYILPTTKKNNIAVLARSVFEHGSLCGVLDSIDLLPEKHILKEKLKGKKLIEMKTKIKKIRNTLNFDYKKLIAYAMQFCLNQPSVTALVLGMSSKENIKNNVENLEVKFSQSQLKMGILF